MLGDTLFTVVHDDLIDHRVGPGPEADHGGVDFHISAVDHGRGRNGEMHPGVLSAAAFDTDEGTAMAYRGYPRRVLYLHTGAMDP